MSHNERISRRLKHIGLVIAAQIGCLAVGLWVQHRYVYSTMYYVAENRAWDELAAAAAEVMDRVEDLDSSSGPSADSPMGRLANVISSHSFASGAQVTVVDNAWRVARDWPNITLQDNAPCRLGALLQLTAAPERSDLAPRGQTGVLQLPDGEHLVVARSLPDGAGHVMFHLPVAHLRSRTEAGLQSLPAVGWMSLIWTGALLSISAYMILSRVFEQQVREQQAAETKSLRRIQSLVRTRDAVMFGLAKLADSRDPETGDHLERISLYSYTLASLLRRHAKYADVVTANFVRTIGIGSVLHDIGKVGIDDDVLRKPGRLTDTERQHMQTHTVIGGECLRDIEQRLGSSNFLQTAREIAFSHHERWDGTGYPFGLAGEQIPLSARIVAIVDVYDALSSKRVYKDALPHAQCVQTIREGAGAHFDPELVVIWLESAGRFREIARRYVKDTEPVATADERPHDASAPRAEDRLVPALAFEER